MKKLSSLIAFAFVLHSAIAQNVAVEKVEIISTIAKNDVSSIPHLSDKLNLANPVVDKINSYLLESLELPSYKQSDVTEFRWSGVTFDAEVKSGIAWIKYKGEYYAAYPSYVEEELFFDLSTGEKLDNTDLPFQALFSLHGYLDFLNKYWITIALKDKFKEAITCAETEPSCSFYDIKYSIEKGKFKVVLEADCYPHAMQACSPDHSIEIPIDSVKPYLTEATRKILFDDRYCEKRGVDKYLYNKSAWKNIPDNSFLFGLINDKYPISMAIAIDQKSGATAGYYYYDKKKQDLNLKGTFANNILDMTESSGKTATGKFYFTWTREYNAEAFPIYHRNGESEYLNGTWLSMDGSKKFPIRFTEVVRLK